MKSLLVACNVVLLALSGCSSDTSEHPPTLTSGGTTNPVSCDALNDPGAQPSISAAGTLVVPGGEAGCLAQGQQCPLSWAQGECDAAWATAECLDNRWRFTCWSEDAGAEQPDASEEDGAGE